MAERIPEVMGESAQGRRHVARLGFVPNSVLFENLRGFYRVPENLQRIGRQGLILYSVNSIPVERYPKYIEGELDPGSISMPEVDRIDSELRHLGSNDQRMQMADTLGFARLANRAIAIEMNVLLSDRVADKLRDTPFLDEDGMSVPVRLRLVEGEHAPGVDMQKAARKLDDTLKSDRYPRPGIESVGVRIL